MEVNCPTCKEKVVWNEQSKFRPFCSKRCQLIDLGEWSDEKMSIPAGPSKESEQQAMPDIEDIEAMLAQQEQDFFKS
ncbi:DNA gyrase inhibitor YacG [Aliiglaciecola sp. LCG003]|uniref:DNA gyrase inhibitor YacG n=1 Tax=Aliiglaciecola sp. LCG003 TaxID=3053655 RepID=UPI0025738F3B|nr:DNA gyrase inhibitor YacG [Aliiglaciecola sp. LCG003]WJG10196.1 DNA gyrase inhibitor YacG [Aliiglaciecola sp. LCG003]